MNQIECTLVIDSGIHGDTQSLVHVLRQDILPLLYRNIVIVLIRIEIELLLEILIEYIRTVHIESCIGREPLCQPRHLQMHGEVSVQIRTTVPLIPHCIIHTGGRCEVILLGRYRTIVGTRIPDIHHRIIFDKIAPDIF